MKKQSCHSLGWMIQCVWNYSTTATCVLRYMCIHKYNICKENNIQYILYMYINNIYIYNIHLYWTRIWCICFHIFSSTCTRTLQLCLKQAGFAGRRWTKNSTQTLWATHVLTPKSHLFLLEHHLGPKISLNPRRVYVTFSEKKKQVAWHWGHGKSRVIGRHEGWKIIPS